MPDEVETPPHATLTKAARRLRWLLPLFGGSLATFTLLDRLGLGDPVQAPHGAMAAVQAVALVLLASGFLCVVISAMWLHAASAMLATRGAAMRHSPTGAWGWYFLPVANLLMPFRAMQEIWRNGVGITEPLLVRWWSAWIVGNIAMSAAARFDTMGGIDNGLGVAFDTVGVAALFVAGLCFARIVARVTQALTGQAQTATFA